MWEDGSHGTLTTLIVETTQREVGISPCTGEAQTTKVNSTVACGQTEGLIGIHDVTELKVQAWG